MPAAGCVSPHQSWPTPKARLMLARPRPVVELMTLRKRPIDWRAPIVTANTPPAASSTSQSATRRFAAPATSMESAIDSLLGLVDRRQAFVEQGVQGDDARLAEPGIERELRPLPFALRLGMLCPAGRRGRDPARAAVGPRADLDPADDRPRLDRG